MDIIVFSDSHGEVEKIEEALQRQIKKPDAVIFLGDGLRDMMNADKGDYPIYSVRGNCDTLIVSYSTDERSLVLGGKKIFFTP